MSLLSLISIQPWVSPHSPGEHPILTQNHDEQTRLVPELWVAWYNVKYGLKNLTKFPFC